LFEAKLVSEDTLGVKDGDGEGGGGWIKLDEDGDREIKECICE
jgi:hypothetical protein